MTSIDQLDFFDPKNEEVFYNINESIIELNSEFKQWLEENGYYFDEASTANVQQWFTKWKGNIVSQIKDTLTKFANFTQQQIAQDSGWLEKYQQIIMNQRQYPVKTSNQAQNVPNYQAALQRLKRPLSTSLNGINMNKVDTDQTNKGSNLMIQKLLIPEYDGNSDFSQFAKQYFYGGETRLNMNTRQLAALMPAAYQFCSNYSANTKSFSLYSNLIISYINKDPNTGENNPTTQADQNMIAASQQQNQALKQAGFASTNPGANNGVSRPVNADTDYSLFMRKYFQTDIFNEALPNQPVQASTPNQASFGSSSGVPSGLKSALQPSTKNAGSITTNNTDPNANATQNNAVNKQQPNGVPSVDANAIAYKKKQIVCNIVRDCFNAKLTAMGMVYRDFMFLMRMHVASYTNNQPNQNQQQ